MEDSPKKSKGSTDKKPNPQSGNLVWYVLGLMALLLLLGTLWGGQSRLTIKWSDLERLIAKSDDPADNWIDIEDTSTSPPRMLKLYGLSDIKIGNTEVTGNVKAEVLQGGLPATNSDASEEDPSKGPKTYAFRTNRLPNEQILLTLLHDHGLEHTMAESPSPFLSYLPMLTFTGLLILLMVIMMRRMGGAGSPMAFGRSRAKLYVQEDIEVTFDDVAGVDEAVDELREVVDFLKNPDRYQQLGGRIPKGVLLVGPPGTGKTLLAKAVAGEAGVSFFSLSGSDFVEMFVGVGAARVRDMFSQAEQRAPCIIFIDELDALGKTRGSGQIGGHDEREQTLNALLVEMDGFGSNIGVIVMAATNRPETLDPALLRPGRFDRHVLVDRPDVSGREEILEVHLVNIKVADDVKVKEVAAITSGFVGADLANVVNEAALLAARKGKKSVTRADFLEAVERASIGLEKKSRIIHDEEKIRLAYHEAGHALVAYSLPNTDPVHKVSIIPRGLSALGYMQQRPERDRYMMTRGQLESSIQVALAGTLAEELIFEDVATGASNDLERATETARSMVMDYGMSRLGRVNYRENNRNPFLATGSEGGRMASHSEQTAREIDEEVKRILDESLDRARSILETRRAALVAISEELMTQEVIDAEELKRIVEANSPSPMIVPGTDAGQKRTAKAADTKADNATGSVGG